jgi:hypothetical protein
VAGELQADLPPTLMVHRLGGAALENLRLKATEEVQVPPGISVFVGGTPQETARQMREAFRDARKYSRLHAASTIVASATLADVRQAGFDVLPDPTRRFANHGRLVHPLGRDGFSDERLTELSRVFHTTSGC